jgi:transposase
MQRRLDECTGTQKGDLTGPSPVDRGKPGTKIHAVVDRRGVPLAVTISAGNTHDCKLLLPLIDTIQPVRGRTGRPRRRPVKLHADKGYDHRFCRQGLRQRHIAPRIARRGIESSQRLGRHRYIIERTLEWLSRYRRLQRRYERKAAHFLAFVTLACAIVCYRKLSNKNSSTTPTP